VRVSIHSAEASTHLASNLAQTFFPKAAPRTSASHATIKSSEFASEDKRPSAVKVTIAIGANTMAKRANPDMRRFINYG
jgi:hypothetical protein